MALDRCRRSCPSGSTASWPRNRRRSAASRSGATSRAWWPRSVERRRHRHRRAQSLSGAVAGPRGSVGRRLRPPRGEVDGGGELRARDRTHGQGAARERVARAAQLAGALGRGEPRARPHPLLRRDGADRPRGPRVGRGMSRYETNVVLYRLKKDAVFRDRFRADPGSALADADLTDEEREAFVRWDTRKLNDLGGSLHLLISIPGLGGH